MIRIYDIKWETGGEDVDLPLEVETDEYVFAEHPTDWLMDRYHWPASGCKVEQVEDIVEDGK